MHKAVVGLVSICTCGLAGGSFLVALRRFLPLAGGGCSGASAAAALLAGAAAAPVCPCRGRLLRFRTCMPHKDCDTPHTNIMRMLV